MRVTVKFGQPVPAFSVAEIQIPSRTFPPLSLQNGSGEGRSYGSTEYLSPSRLLGPLAFRAENDGYVANTGSFPTHTSAGNTSGKDDHLAR